jgi:hypothetical protein
MAETLTVAKTLVVGLGSSGSEVCDAIARRIKWEYGGIAKTPWVRFLCVETEAGKILHNLPSSDLVALTISPLEYSQVTQFLPAYDEAIGLRDWADRETIAEVEGSAVSDGAGNRRMVGRLALLFPKNYQAVHNALEGRLNQLRGLKSPDAKEALGKLADGTEPQVVFSNAQQLRVFVVGSLCGGTCSGTVSDFGYIIRSLLHPEERTVGVFTLPLPTLTAHDVPRAERFKKNAYTALTELNHYSRMGVVEKPDIRLGGKVIKTSAERPYGAPFLVTPSNSSSDAIRKMHSSVADRIFLNVFVPQVDSFSKLVDAGISDRNGHAHVFCTFGLSSLEFPKYQVIDACAKKLLLKAIRGWRLAAQDAAAAKGTLSGAGFDPKEVKALLLKTDKGQDISVVVGDLISKIVDTAVRSPQEAQTLLASLRASFTPSASSTVLSGGLAPGCAPAWCSDRVDEAVEHVASRLRSHIEATLLTANGLSATRDLLAQAKDTIGVWRTLKATSAKAYEETTDTALNALEGGGPGCLALWKRKERADRIGALRTALHEERDAHLEALWRGSVAGESGVAARLAPEVIDIWKRHSSLWDRTGHMVDRLDREVSELSQTEPADVNGKTIFDADRDTGTVALRYKKEIEGQKLPKETVENAEVRLAADVLTTWTDLPGQLFPGAEPDWLAESVDPTGELVPRRKDEALMDRARTSFLKLMGESVIGQQGPQFDAWLGEAMNAMRPSVHVDDALAQEGQVSPISRRYMVFIPEVSGREKIWEVLVAKGAPSSLEVHVSPDPSRILFLTEFHRFPLYAVPSVVAQQGSLAQANCNEFPWFFTRKDVYWTGLSREEHDRLEQAEELILVALLLRKLIPQGGSLRFPIAATQLGAPETVELPYSVRAAAHALNPHQAWGAAKGSKFSHKLAALEDLVNVERKLVSSLAFVQTIRSAFNSGTANEVPEFSDLAPTVFQRYCSRSEELYKAYREVFPPSEAKISLLTRMRGQVRSIGGTYEEAGLYCEREDCCSWIGKDAREAAQNGWRCFAGGHDCAPN